MDRRKIIFMAVITTTIFLFTRCFRYESVKDPRGEAYAGSAACTHCHGSIDSSYMHTAHYLSTRLADGSSIMGSFEKDSDELLVNDSTRILMEKTDSGFYQSVFVKNKKTSTHRMDLVMGSVKGQTYLELRGKEFYELPVSWVTNTYQWTASPGYHFDDMHFNRPVVSACFECHSAYAAGDPQILNVAGVQKRNWVYAIDCERCHGPAAAHVAFHNEHPGEKRSKYLVHFQTLPRERRMDLCATCHSGTKSISLKSTFAFKMGDTLRNYKVPLPSVGEVLDVHGNQARLLAASKCYQMSSLDCTTCHDTHVNQRNLLKSFNAKCQTCHAAVKHKDEGMNSMFRESHCTNCHMPVQASTAITMQSGGQAKSISALVVNHRIGIYPMETKKDLKENKTN